MACAKPDAVPDLIERAVTGYNSGTWALVISKWIADAAGSAARTFP
jgi:hypothetical protein